MSHFWIISNLIILSIMITAAIAGLSAAPWLPTRKKYRKILLKNLIIAPNQIIYDLGCGTGILLFDLSKLQPNAKYIGFEISILPYLIAKTKSLFYKNISIKYGNLFKQDLKDADIILIFLLEKAYNKLIKNLQQTKTDCKIILEAWPFSKIKPQRTIKEENILPIFFYSGKQFKD